MITYAHTAPTIIWEEKLAHVDQLLHVTRTRTATPLDGRDVMITELRRGAILARLSETGQDCTQQLIDAMARAAGGGHAALWTAHLWIHREDEKQVCLHEPGHSPKLHPTGFASFSWPDWIKALCAAIICKDERAIATLTLDGHIRDCAAPGHVIDAFWPRLCHAWSALLQGHDDVAGDLLEKTRAMLPTATRMDPSLRDQSVAPVLDVMEAFLGRGMLSFNQATRQALAQHKIWHSGRGAYDYQPLIALELTALAALYARTSRDFIVRSSYIPMALLDEHFEVEHSQVSVVSAPDSSP